LEPEELPRTSDGLFFRKAKVIWPGFRKKSTEELAASSDIKETVNCGQELEVILNGAAELIYFSEYVCPNDPKNLSLIE